MTPSPIVIWLIVLLISLSGVLVNIFKTGEKVKVKYSEDRGTLFVFRVIVLSALGLSLMAYHWQIGRVIWSPMIIYSAYFLLAVGLIIRWVAIRSLGDAFTVKVTILDTHPLKVNGLYQWVRHPSYSGLLLYYFSLGLIMQNWISLLLLTLGPLIAVINRILIEEAVLIRHFREAYTNYQKRTWRLFPFIY